MDSGCAVTAVRASIYTEFFETLLDGATVDGELRLPAEDARVALVARADVGRCLAACALLPPSGPLDVTGPAALDMAALAAARGASYVPVSEAEFAAGVAQRETPWWAYAYTSLFGSIREHRWEVVTDTVEKLTGEPALPAV